MRVRHHWIRYDRSPDDARSFVVRYTSENTEQAEKFAREQLEPLILSKNAVVLDFLGMEIATQSYLHALLYDALRLAWAKHSFYLCGECEPVGAERHRARRGVCAWGGSEGSRCQDQKSCSTSQRPAVPDAIDTQGPWCGSRHPRRRDRTRSSARRPGIRITAGRRSASSPWTVGAAAPAGEGWVVRQFSSDRCSPPNRGKVVATLAARISGQRLHTPLEPPDELPPIDSGCQATLKITGRR